MANSSVIMINKKLCAVCLIEKDIVNFNRNGKYFSFRCRECEKEYKAKYYEKNKTSILTNQKNKYFVDSNRKILNSRNYYANNREKCIKKATEYRLNNKESVNLRLRKYYKKRRSEDVNFKISNNLRTRLWIAIKSKGNTSHINDLGCSIEQLKIYLEKMFDENMTWENYGSYWHIDHIKPLTGFDLTIENEARKACHYTNLQPLEASANIRKGGIRKKRL